MKIINELLDHWKYTLSYIWEKGFIVDSFCILAIYWVIDTIINNGNR